MESNAAAAKTKTKLKGNKKEEKDKNPKGKAPKGKGKDVVLNHAKFEGPGLSYKAKLFGFVEVPGPRGDHSSIQAIQKLKQHAKQLKKGANEHKLKITFNITLQGVRLYNEKTQTIEHEHPIHKISFISHDPEDRHVFGYIYSPPRTAANEARKYYLYAIKSDKSADVITVQLYELFQVVYKMQENKKIQGKDSSHKRQHQPLEPLQNKMLLEMSNKIGGDQQQYSPDEHLYAEPTFLKSTPSGPASSDFTIPSDQPALASSGTGSNKYQVPRRDEEISEREKEDIATAIALSLSMEGNSQASGDKPFTPTTNDSSFEAVFDPTMSVTTEEIPNQNAFHAEFPPFENGFTSSQAFHRASESSNDSEKFNKPVSDEIPMSTLNQLAINAAGDISVNTEVKTEFETNFEIKTASDDEEEFPSSQAQPNDFTIDTSKTEDENFNSAKVELESGEKDAQEVSLVNTGASDLTSFESEFKIEKQTDGEESVKAETSTTTDRNIFATQASFEVNFETENEDFETSKQNEKDTFTFDAPADAFPNEDPFASTAGTSEFDQSAFNAFTEDDPFSPKCATKIDTKADPFAEIDNPFTADFSDISNTNDFEFKIEDVSNESNSENDQSSNREDDLFEEIFEAKMEGQFENENSDKGEDEKEKLDSIPTTNQVDLEKSGGDANVELEDKEKEVVETLEENENLTTLPNENTTETVQEADNSFITDSEHLEDQNEVEQTGDGMDVNVSEENAFDFSSNDVYVTLKTAAQHNNRAQSPNEFSPPPLPPRPIISVEPIDTITAPKIPPALPPRPSMNAQSVAETISRKPPELPPRLDLEENGLVENLFVDTMQETSTEAFSSLPENDGKSFDDAGSPVFQANFDTFDFDNIESTSPVETVVTPKASGFDHSDPFKDPFAGSDPFQTPIAGDPFTSPTSFNRGVQPGSDDFDPFSGHDPFAMTPAFDAQASFSSPFNANSSSSDEKKDDEKNKFDDFSTSFT
ncbi:uncharacterized protein LOC114526298 [Dendronephthya gigantea]|uniref:uncharacterized protein LOC114526298 n=1 Tax=Dendronephthya gigantea TaxID=151771 RepID=UPI00106D19B1|nr:uncharacterized protein LOC114526298 [Dendronephthya gigantea]